MTSVLTRISLTVLAICGLAVSTSCSGSDSGGKDGGSPASPSALSATTDACPNADLAPLPPSAGLAIYIKNRSAVRSALLCLINAERAATNAPPVQSYIGLRGSSAVTLSQIAGRHANAAASIRWWGKAQSYKNKTGKDCTVLNYDTSRCDSHINPETGSTIETRIKDPSYCRSPRALRSFAENTYNGAGVAGQDFAAFRRGDQLSTPRAAVRWWMWSQGHRENMLNPEFKEVGIGIVPVSANPDMSATFSPAGSYVTDYANCS